jgi:hypothetical protein
MWMRPPVQFILVSVAVVLLSSQATANTSIIVVRTENFTVIAADSKLTTSDGTVAGTACKIHVANDVVWVEAGLKSENGGPLDVWRTIAEAVESKKSPEDLIDDLRDPLKIELSMFLRRFRIDRPDQYYKIVLMDGYNPIEIAVMQGNIMDTMFFVIPDRNDPNNIAVVAKYCPGPDCPDGNVTLELGEHRAIDEELKTHPDIWAEKGALPTLEYLIGLQSEATPMIVGPPVAVLQINKDGSIHWLEKGSCD